MGPIKFVSTSARFVLSGGKAYWLWISFLLLLIVWGGLAYVDQFRAGLIVTNMRDQVSWAFYIGNFTFLVGWPSAPSSCACFSWWLTWVTRTVSGTWSR
jgi:Ni/Fe-hydrogenase subunit HybB-like protein